MSENLEPFFKLETSLIYNQGEYDQKRIKEKVKSLKEKYTGDELDKIIFQNIVKDLKLVLDTLVKISLFDSRGTLATLRIRLKGEDKKYDDYYEERLNNIENYNKFRIELINNRLE